MCLPQSCRLPTACAVSAAHRLVCQTDRAQTGRLMDTQGQTFSIFFFSFSFFKTLWYEHLIN